jgi:hypothetical protein
MASQRRPKEKATTAGQRPARRYDRLLAIAEQEYTTGRMSTGLLYARRGDRRYTYDGQDRRDMRAELRAAWTRKQSGEGLGEDVIRAVIDELRRRSGEATLDEPTAAEQGAEMAAQLTAGPEDAASAYYTENGCTWWARPTRDGAIPVMLATFTAEIAEEVTLDDGAERTLTWLVRVAARDGRSGETQITPDQLGRPHQWATRAAGTSALVMPGQAIADHLRVAVQSRSASVTRKTTYIHTGWRQIDGHWAHLTSSGALGAAGLDEAVTVDLGPNLAGYALPDPRDVRAVREAVKESLALIELAPDTVTVPWLAAAYRAPLPLPPDCAVWMYGESGTFKSEQCALGQQHYGPTMHVKNLPGNWTSSANDLEVTAFMLDGVLFVVDDYSPDATRTDAARRAAAADRLIRGSANRSGRGRLRPDGTRRPVKLPRGQILTSAEDLPPSVKSLRARTFVVKVAGGDVSIPELTEAQKTAAAGTYAVAMAGYVQLLAVRYDADHGLPRALVAARDRFRDTAKGEGHPRHAENIASLALGWHEFLAFAEAIGAVTAAERAACWSRAWMALRTVGAEQENYAADADPVTIYLSSIRALIASGRVHVAGQDGGCPVENPVRWGWAEGMSAGEPLWRPQGDLIGWTDGTDLYLESSIAYKLARQHAEAEGQPLTTSKRMVHEHLSQRNLLASTAGKGHLTARRRLGGTQQTVVHLTINKFDSEAA